jgi:hypothetical protein
MNKARAWAVGGVVAALAFGGAAPAAADAQGNSSCIGIEASSVSPPGSSDEFPGGMAELQAFLRDVVGHPTGAVISAVAKLHLGSHEACDEATE